MFDFSVREKRAIYKGIIDMMPLNFAVLPWGILVGSLAIQQGFSFIEAMLMSLLMYAGAAQLVAMELMVDGASLWVLLATVFVISSRHFLYGLTLREKLKCLPLKPRVAVAFVLTDELFAYSGHQRAYTNKIRLMYGLSAGFSFYIFWNIWTLVGIIAGSILPDLTHLGLDFAIAVTFIALVIPSIKSVSILVAVVTSAVIATFLHWYQFELALLVAALVGMTVGYLCSPLDNINRKNSCSQKSFNNEEAVE